MSRRSLFGCVLAAALALAACSDDSTDESTAADSSVSTQVPAPATEPAAPEPTVGEPATSAVAVEPTAPAPEPTPAPTTEPAAVRNFSAIGPVVEAFVAERGLNGAGLVIVDRDDGVVHEHYSGQFSADRVSLVASSSKMVTAGVLLRLQDDGLLDINTPIADYVDWASAHPEITVAQLLSNSSGLVGLLPDPAYGPYVCQFLPPGDIEDCAASILSSPDDDADVVPPDTEFRYGGAQWQVAGAVAETVSGKPWAQLIEEIYVEPCGLTSTAYNNHFTQLGTASFDYPTAFEADPTKLQATDNPNMEGGLYTTPTDYSRLMLMHLRGGQCDGGQVLSQAALDTMHADRVAATYGGEPGYGMGWWVDRASGRISDGGAYGSIPWLDLADGYGAYLVIEADNTTGNELASALYDIVDDAMNP